MRKDQLDRLFEPFFTTRRASGHKGLGLSIVRRLVKDHEGFIDVRSEIGGGIWFEIYFPACAAPEAEPVQTGTARKGRILIAADQPWQRNFLQMILAKASHDVTTVGCGDEALALLREARKQKKPSSFDIIILDLVAEDAEPVPGVCRQIKALYPKHRLIISSGRAAPQGPAACLPPNAEWLLKPFESKQLTDLVQRVLA